ncbi:MAG: endonuclease/exonuclease/phosphatase family protein [Bacteroidota bacterium]
MRLLQTFTMVLIIWSTEVEAQSVSRSEMTWMFYNVENLFDVQDDSLTRDEAFLPDGDRHWTYGRFLTKLNRIYKVIAGVGEWNPPAIVGLAEVENRYVLEALLRETPLHRLGYQIIHQESPDARGIDVVLLFRPDLVSIEYQEYITVSLPNGRKTRDILYARVQLSSQDTVHLYLNHWPSRYSGTKISEESRKQAAATLAAHIQQVVAERPDAQVLVTGDFNDAPEDVSMQQLVEQTPLRNISQYQFEGTHKYQGEWSVLDQWLASESWFRPPSDWVIDQGRGQIYSPDWLLEPDEANLGFKPNRTYVGFQYHGGFSDHLPVFIRLISRSPVSSLKE